MSIRVGAHIDIFGTQGRIPLSRNPHPLSTTRFACPQEKSDVEPELPPALAAARAQLTELALATAAVQRDAGLQVSVGRSARMCRYRGLACMAEHGCLHRLKGRINGVCVHRVMSGASVCVME